MLKKAKTPLMQQVEAKYGKPIEVLIPELFRQHGSMPKVAAAIGIPYDTVYFWSRKYKLVTYEPRSVRFPAEEAMQGQ